MAKTALNNPGRWPAKDSVIVSIAIRATPWCIRCGLSRKQSFEDDERCDGVEGRHADLAQAVR